MRRTDPTRPSWHWLAAVLLGAVACMRTGGPAVRPPDPTTGALVPVEPFGYERAPFDFTTSRATPEDEAYDTSIVSFDAADRDDPKNARVRAVVRSPGRTARGLVLVLPPVVAADGAAAEELARHLAGEGYTTVRFEAKRHPFDPSGDWSLLTRRLRQSVVDVRRGIDWAVATDAPGVGRGIGLVGLGLGASLGALVTAADDRVDGAVLMLGAGDLAELLRTAADDEQVAAFRRALEARGYDEARILEEAHAALDSIDPLRYAPFVDPTRILFVDARFDRVVPLERATAYWEAARQPERVTLPTGHASATLLLPYLRLLTTEHLERTLRR